MRDTRVATIQFQHMPGDKSKNLEIIEEFVRQASKENVELAVFPECCVTGYWHLRDLDRTALLDLSESIPEGPTTQKLKALSHETQVSVGVGLIEESEGRLYNSYVVVMPDGRVACHRKLHCFINAEMDSGNEFTVFDLPNGNRAAILICYDNNLIENVRACALRGAELLIAPHQTGGCRSGSPFAMGSIDVELWENREKDPQAVEAEFRGDKGRGWLLRWLPARAHDNGLFVVFSNGVGRDDDEVRTGNAMVLDPYGRTIVETWAARNEMLVADLDASLRERSTGQRWIRARRPELYQDLVRETGDERPTREVRFEFDDSALKEHD